MKKTREVEAVPMLRKRMPSTVFMSKMEMKMTRDVVPSRGLKYHGGSKPLEVLS